MNESLDMDTILADAKPSESRRKLFATMPKVVMDYIATLYNMHVIPDTNAAEVITTRPWVMEALLLTHSKVAPWVTGMTGLPFLSLNKFAFSMDESGVLKEEFEFIVHTNHAHDIKIRITNNSYWSVETLRR